MAETGVSLNVSSTSKNGDNSSLSRDTSEPVTNQQCDADRLKTIQVLMGWPIFSFTVKKVQQFYEMLKSSNRISNWSCHVSEKVASTLVQRFAPVKAIVCPGIRIVDLATSDLAETVQKKLPVVKQPPSKVYEAVKSRFCQRIASVVDKFDFMVNVGERRLRKVAKTTVETYRKMAAGLDKWMEGVEKCLDKSYAKAPQVPGEGPLTQPQTSKSWAPAKTAVIWATNIAMFYVGVAVWVVSRVPLVGQFVSVTPPSSKSTSPTHMAQKSSSSSYESIPESMVGEGAKKLSRSDLNLENPPSSQEASG